MHMIDMSNARENIAYTGEAPWHQLGHQLDPDAALEVWCKQAGLTWIAEESPVYRMDIQSQGMAQIANRKALYRSDTGFDLGVVSNRYQVVQPREVVEFYRSLVEKMGYKMEVAGALQGGRRVWALAKTGEVFVLPGNDTVDGYILLATSYDGSLATLATRTSVRVVCQNTLTFAVGKEGNLADVRIPHNAVFNPDMIKGQMGLETNAAWEQYQEHCAALARRKVSRKEAVEFFIDLLYPTEEEEVLLEKPQEKQVATLLDLAANAPGQDLASANDTAWGLVNAVTYLTDHTRRARTADNRLNRAWFGDGAKLKQAAFNQAIKLAA